MRPVYIPVGHIVNAHGIKGEVKLNPEGFTPEFVAEFDTLLYKWGARAGEKPPGSTSPRCF